MFAAECGCETAVEARSHTQAEDVDASKAHSLPQIRTTRIAGGLLLGYNPWKAGARLKTPAFTLFRPYCP